MPTLLAESSDGEEECTLRLITDKEEDIQEESSRPFSSHLPSSSLFGTWAERVALRSRFRLRRPHLFFLYFFFLLVEAFVRSLCLFGTWHSFHSVVSYQEKN